MKWNKCVKIFFGRAYKEKISQFTSTNENSNFEILVVEIDFF